jgi:hypothetical protein
MGGPEMKPPATALLNEKGQYGCGDWNRIGIVLAEPMEKHDPD